MRPGPPRGETATRTVIAEPSRCHRAGSNTGPMVYATSALVTDVEVTCRTLVEPHLEVGETAVDAGVDLRLRTLVPADGEVEITAAVASVMPTKVICEVQARHRGRVVARGSFELRIVAETQVDAELAGAPSR